jgi:hypothetical protein
LLVNRARLAVCENAAIKPDFADVSQMGVSVLTLVRTRLAANWPITEAVSVTVMPGAKVTRRSTTPVKLAAAGYNFRRILSWLRDLLCQILITILRVFIRQSTLNPAS